MSDKIKAALQKLDAGNDNHWTQDGSPRLETVKFNNDGEAVSREEIEDNFPAFNKSTAAGYWLNYEAPATGAPQAAETPAAEQGGGEAATAPAAAPLPEQGSEQGNEPPSANGEGASPSEAVPEGTDEPAGGDAEAQAEQPEVELGGDDSDALQELETTLQEIQEHIAGLRGQVDDINLEVDRVALIERDVYNAIQKAKHDRGDNKPANAIQEYLASQKRISIARGEVRRGLSESGVNLKELIKSASKSPLDQSMARPTARRGRGSGGM